MPEPRKIYCKCGVYLGIIRDATLRKGIVYLCEKCDIKRVASDLLKVGKKYDLPEGFDDLFGSSFGKK